MAGRLFVGSAFLRSRGQRTFALIFFGLAAAGVLLAGSYVVYWRLNVPRARYSQLGEWFRNAAAHPDWTIQAGQRCGEAPFLLPTDGYIGFIWGDSFRRGHRHQGVDIFGSQEPGVTRVVAAYGGYLTRMTDWKSSLIIRIPQDPLDVERQIWVYYTHMADTQGNDYIVDRFPPGAQEVYVEAGTLLGYQGNYSGDPFNPTGVHLHISIVQDDGQGLYRNELEIRNTLDPSPYFGLPLNAWENKDVIPVCAR